jgi:hypothetical protein
MVKKSYLGLFLIYVVLAPVHVFDPGLPQPADFLMLVLLLILAAGYIVTPPLHRDLYLIAALWLGYVIVVNLYWRTQYETKAFLLNPLYYTFNIAAFVLTISLVREFRKRFSAAFKIALAIAVGLEIVALFLLPGTTYRSVGTFSNPNQLGYWALLTGVCMFVLQGNERLGLLNLAVLCGAGYLTMASLSKAAMLSFVLLMLLGLVCQRLTRPSKVALFTVVFVSTAVALAEGSLMDRFLSEGIFARAAERLNDIGGQADDSAGGRGYDRIWRYPEHLMFGAGEGAAWRFAGPINPRQYQKELHSTLGTVLFSYGIIGFGLFLAFLVMVFRRAPLAHVLYTLPVWAYGMTHQGLRESMLWILFGLVYGLARYVQLPPPQVVPSGDTTVEHGSTLLAVPRARRSKAPNDRAIAR